MKNEGKVEEFRRVFQGALTKIAAETVAAERCLILSGGVDTCAILSAAGSIGMKFAAAVTVITGEDSPDKDFAVAAAKQGVENGTITGEHHVLCLTASGLLDTYLPICVEKLRTFDGMTLRNSLVIAAAFRQVAELGCKYAVTGDGADELFGGYSFMWGCADDHAEWKGKRDGMCKKWTFATADLAGLYGIVPHSPYMHADTAEWALSNTVRCDCIGDVQIRLKYLGDTQEHTAGKIILRKAYDTVAAWRRKDPIEVGSGVTVISKDTYWDDTLSDEEFLGAKKDLLDRGFVIKNKEHLVNFRSFEHHFGRNGVNLPDKKRCPLGQGCAGCCFEVGDNTFCHICGAWPAQRKIPTK